MTATAVLSEVSAEERVSQLTRVARGLIKKRDALTGKAKSHLRLMIRSYETWRLEGERGHGDARTLTIEGSGYCDAVKRAFVEIIDEALSRVNHPATFAKSR